MCNLYWGFQISVPIQSNYVIHFGQKPYTNSPFADGIIVIMCFSFTHWYFKTMFEVGRIAVVIFLSWEHVFNSQYSQRATVVALSKVIAAITLNCLTKSQTCIHFQLRGSVHLNNHLKPMNGFHPSMFIHSFSVVIFIFSW